MLQSIISSGERNLNSEIIGAISSFSLGNIWLNHPTALHGLLGFFPFYESKNASIQLVYLDIYPSAGLRKNKSSWSHTLEGFLKPISWTWVGINTLFRAIRSSTGMLTKPAHPVMLAMTGRVSSDSRIESLLKINVGSHLTESEDSLPFIL